MFAVDSQLCLHHDKEKVCILGDAYTNQHQQNPNHHSEEARLHRYKSFLQSLRVSSKKYIYESYITCNKDFLFLLYNILV